MAKWTVGKGMDEYLAKLGNLEFQSPHECGKAVYQGAKIIADQIKANIEALPVEPNRAEVFGPWKKGRRNPTAIEKAGLIDGFGIATMQNDGGFYNVKIGMDGYNGDHTDKYPNGKPNAMIARSIEIGNVFMKRIPFISKAVSSKRGAAEAAMKRSIEEYINKTMR